MLARICTATLQMRVHYYILIKSNRELCTIVSSLFFVCNIITSIQGRSPYFDGLYNRFLGYYTYDHSYITGHGALVSFCEMFISQVLEWWRGLLFCKALHPFKKWMHVIGLSFSSWTAFYYKKIKNKIKKTLVYRFVWTPVRCICSVCNIWYIASLCFLLYMFVIPRH